MKAIEQVLENYKTSINEADTVLASTFWLTTPQASFIHSRGHEIGWEEIKSGIYGMFGSRFSKRQLNTRNETIQLYGDMAVIVFYWVFDATFDGENPVAIQTKGRETQVLKKMGANGKLSTSIIRACQKQVKEKDFNWEIRLPVILRFG
jgi:hypothetical protein